jgi:hypothetical protein
MVVQRRGLKQQSGSAWPGGAPYIINEVCHGAEGSSPERYPLNQRQWVYNHARRAAGVLNTRGY